MELLISYSEKYQNLYKQPNQSVFHTVISCICSQQVQFQIGRGIRKELYKKCGFPLTPNKVREIDLSEIKNLTLGRRNLILEVCEIVEAYDSPDNDGEKEILDEIFALDGIGEWTKNAVSILLGLSDAINLSNDAYIRKNISLYLSKPVVFKECHNFISLAADDQTKVCYFLWRIKKESVYKINKNLELTKQDFV
jgi:3-methyladenine DNA glycosylase/8-oxoguanine DNA glycosylase